MRVITWNTQRKRPSTPKGRAAVERIEVEAADVVVLTEAWVGHLEGGHEIAVEPAMSKGHSAGERKVVCWSASPWRSGDTVGHGDMPPGRYVAGTTDTPLGSVRVHGVCIPWHMCDVRYGSADKAPWEQHLRWLAAFGELLEDRDRSVPHVIAGDFNQRVPRVRGNKAAAAALAKVFADLGVVTAGVLAGCERPGIDHVAISADLAATNVRGWAHDDGGVRMSDHDAAVVELARR